MKKRSILILSLLMPLTFLFAQENNVKTNVDMVTVYHSGALVKRSGKISLNAGVHELMFKNLSSKMVLSSLKISNKNVTILNKSIINKLSAEEFSQLSDKKDALNKQLDLIEAKYADPQFVSKVEDLEKMASFYASKIQQIKKELRMTERAIAEAMDLENIQIDNEDAALLKLKVSVEGKLSEDLKLQYVCGGIGWGPAYDVIVNSSADQSITFKYQAKIMSQTGEDWNDVVINLSSAFPLESPTELPKIIEPWIISRRNMTGMEPPIQSEQEISNQANLLDTLEGVEYVDIDVPAFLKLRTLPTKYSIKSNSTVFTFPIQSIDIKSNYYYYAHPGIDPEVYLVAQITGWDTLNFVDGLANVNYKGNEIGKSVIKFSESKDTLVLPIGKDNSVYLKRSEINDQKYFKASKIGKKRQATLAYRFELKNNNPFPINFELFDQIPISQTKTASVEIINKSNGKVDQEAGEINWSLNLKQGELLDKKLIYKIEIEGGSYNSFRFLKRKSRYSKARYTSPRFL